MVIELNKKSVADENIMYAVKASDPSKIIAAQCDDDGRMLSSVVIPPVVVSSVQVEDVSGTIINPATEETLTDILTEVEAINTNTSTNATEATASSILINVGEANDKTDQLYNFLGTDATHGVNLSDKNWSIGDYKSVASYSGLKNTSVVESLSFTLPDLRGKEVLVTNGSCGYPITDDSKVWKSIVSNGGGACCTISNTNIVKGDAIADYTSLDAETFNIFEKITKEHFATESTVGSILINVGEINGKVSTEATLAALKTSLESTIDAEPLDYNDNACVSIKSTVKNGETDTVSRIAGDEFGNQQVVLVERDTNTPVNMATETTLQLLKRNNRTLCLEADNYTNTVDTVNADGNPTQITHEGSGYEFTQTISYDVNGFFAGENWAEVI